MMTVLDPEAAQATATVSKTATDRLVTYFSGAAPRLLRPAQGVLRYPSISPSLPGKAHSTQLWDWDTYSTARGLFRLARLTGDKDLHRNVSEHARGSLLNFFDHQSEDGRIPIMMDVNNPDFFGCLRTKAPNPDPNGIEGRRITQDGPVEVWDKPLTRGRMAVGLFNSGESPLPIAVLLISGQQQGAESGSHARDLDSAARAVPPAYSG